MAYLLSDKTTYSGMCLSALGSCAVHGSAQHKSTTPQPQTFEEEFEHAPVKFANHRDTLAEALLSEPRYDADDEYTALIL